MTSARPAIGAGWVLPTCPRLATPSTDSPAAPAGGPRHAGGTPGQPYRHRHGGTEHREGSRAEPLNTHEGRDQHDPYRPKDVSSNASGPLTGDRSELVGAQIRKVFTQSAKSLYARL